MASDPESAGEITELLRNWGSGDTGALAVLVESAYTELRAIARAYMSREAPGHTLQATGLINELYVRLARQRKPHLVDRRHFYALSAMVMRRILRDYSRDTHAQKRSGIRVPLHPEMAWVDAAGEDMVALDCALTELEQLDERKVRVIELRYFLGCTIEEVAELLNVSGPTVERDIQFAKSWLHQRLRAS
ncbi:MAG TPA: ECF-type sigma factor [Bryobacteraceae bacterium]|nr:ECF-type sigma factor [Bryobacteraceae bacterium]